MWFGVIFIRHGLYQDGVFKFTVYIPDNYPDGDCPVSGMTAWLRVPFLSSPFGWFPRMPICALGGGLVPRCVLCHVSLSQKLGLGSRSRVPKLTQHSGSWCWVEYPLPAKGHAQDSGASSSVSLWAAPGMTALSVVRPDTPCHCLPAPAESYASPSPHSAWCSTSPSSTRSWTPPRGNWT